VNNSKVVGKVSGGI